MPEPLTHIEKAKAYADAADAAYHEVARMKRGLTEQEVNGITLTLELSKMHAQIALVEKED